MRGNLSKSILNQEYGWFKNDSSISKTKETTAPRFKISWGDDDSSKTVTEPRLEKKENTIKNIFRK